MTRAGHDVLVIGAGVTGLAATRQALEAGRSVALLECVAFGGLVLNVNRLDGASGSGADLAAGMMSEVLDLGAESVSATALGVSAADGAWTVETDCGPYPARALVVASGARLKRLGIPGEARLEGKGVSHCADCDGPFFRGQDVVVVGGGDSALQSALTLAEGCARVHLVHRGARLRAQAHFAEAVARRANVTLHLETTLEDILGEDAVSGVRLRDHAGRLDTLACSGVFPFVGIEPAAQFLPPEAKRDAAGFLVTDAALETGMARVFAAGAVRSGYRGQIADALAEGATAAGAAVRSLMS